MKSTFALLAAIVALSQVGTAPIILAQPAPGGPGNRPPAAEVEPAMRERVRKAREQAMQNADLKAAQEAAEKAMAEFRAKLHEAMLAIDPGIKDALEQIRSARSERGPRPDADSDTAPKSQSQAP